VAKPGPDRRWAGGTGALHLTTRGRGGRRPSSSRRWRALLPAPLSDAGSEGCFTTKNSVGRLALQPGRASVPRRDRRSGLGRI